ncbi:MAG TPA: ELWxxDGT repeat protein [Candidatus Limnocylindrales bacterium]|jgi:ELWxxDGT repeat protein
MAVVVTLIVIWQTSTVSAAGPPSIVRDINASGNSNPASLTAVGTTLFFTADDGIHGTELWKSDGTAAGTKMVKNIRPYGNSSNPADLVNVNGTLFFTAVDGKHGRELWKSDGTSAGTVLVKDINTHGKNSYGGNGIAVYTSVAVGSRLFFLTHSGGVWGTTLYVSDGTAAGTYWLEAPSAATHEWLDNPPEPDHVADTLGGRFYYVAENDAGKEEIWVSDGTVSGTHRAAGSPQADHLSFLPIHGQSLYFVTYTDDQSNVRLWKTNGTASGTKALTSSGALANVPIEATYMNNRLFFADGAGGALWKTDGTASGTKKIINRQAQYVTAAGGHLYFSAYVDGTGDYLWLSDGSSSGTNPLVSFIDYPASRITAVGNRVCFHVYNWDTDTWRLWQSDGTKVGTYSSGEYVNAAATDGPSVSIGSRYFYVADDGSHGVELWSYTP